MKYLFCQQQKVKHNTCCHKAPNYERRRREGSEIERWKIQSCAMTQRQQERHEYSTGTVLYRSLQGTVVVQTRPST
jgi:hypothetical protein